MDSSSKIENGQDGIRQGNVFVVLPFQTSSRQIISQRQNQGNQPIPIKANMIEDRQIRTHVLSNIFQYDQLPQPQPQPQPPPIRLRGPATRSFAQSGPETLGHRGPVPLPEKKHGDL